MTTAEATGVDELVELDRKVDAAEGDGIMARWEFGRELLNKRQGKKLPAGLLDSLVQQTGKSRSELQYRVQFAKTYETRAELSNVLDNHPSWYSIVNNALPTKRDKLEPLMSSETDQWSTPQDLFDQLDAEFGFDLDVCADETNAKCERYFTVDDNGLAQDWTGTCWMNPPYGEVIGEWVSKAKQAAEGGGNGCLPGAGSRRYRLVVGQLPLRRDPVPQRPSQVWRRWNKRTFSVCRSHLWPARARRVVGTMSYSQFDIDLREGQAREGAFAHVMLRSLVEHKRDKRCTEWSGDKPPTGNLCIEFEQSDGSAGVKPSGIAISVAERWAFEFRAEHWLVVPTERVKELARRAIAEDRVRWTGDNGNRSALVPIRYFIEPVEIPLRVAA